MSDIRRREVITLLGAVKPEGGYGFIAQDGAPDVFVHVSAVRAAGFSDLSRGQRVQFQIGTNARTGRDQATDLTLLDPVISPPVTPHAFRAEDTDAVAHVRFGDQRFMRRQ
jgi:CspA family cold shock protein